MLREDILLQQTVVLLTLAKKEKETNLLVSTDVWSVFDLLRKLNISSSNDFSLSLDTFLLLIILFCK